MKIEWIKHYQDLAQVVKNKSKDESTQIGAIIIGQDKQIVSTGYNSFPRGINDDLPNRQERPIKYFYMEHAERAALFNAALNGVSTKGCSMFLTCDIPCTACSRAIINCGIAEVWYVSGGGSRSPKYKEEEMHSRQMFEEAGIKLIDIKPILGDEYFLS